MLGRTTSPKYDLLTHEREPRTVFPQIALRRRAADHPMVMFATVVAAAFVWTLVPTGPSGSAAPAVEPARSVAPAATTEKSDRLPISDVDRACRGQNWGTESLECLTMIARESGKDDLKVRVIAAASPAALETPNIF